MNKLISATLVLWASLLFGAAQAGTIEPSLEATMEGLDGSDEVSVIVRFSDTVDIKALRKDFAQQLKILYPDPKERKIYRNALKRAMLAQRLQDKAANAKQPALDLLARKGEQGKVSSLWAINALAGTWSVETILELANLAGVDSIGLDAVIQGPGPSSAPTSPTNWNLDAIMAPEVWNLGHTGLGVVVATMDTGADVEHPDLAPGYRAGSNSWFDPYDENPTPADYSGHGTGVLGLIVGGETSGYQIGVAPDAQWIAAKIFDNANSATFSGIHLSYQWMLDPDADYTTNDAPDIVNNSWVLNGTLNQCNQEFAGDIALLNEAEIAVIFSGGNFGPKSNTSMSPANDTGSLSVGSVTSRLKIARSSSRGPSACDGGIYPRLVAPGDDIFTSAPMPGFYNVLSGTSFAVAHVSGAMAVLKGAFPEATISELEDAMTSTAADMGDGGPDNTFGYGMLDMAAAYNDLNGGSTPMPGSLAFSSGNYSAAETAGSISITVTRTGGSAGDVSVNYATSDGTATSGSDYSSAADTLTFYDGETSQSFSVSINDDVDYEGDEAFNVALSNPAGGASLGGQDTAAVSIADDESPPGGGNTIQITNVSYAKDTAVVWATSDLGRDANLSVTFDLAGGGTTGSKSMAWKSKRSRWEVSVRRFTRTYGADPVSVTVSGDEGEITTPVQ
jgi:serine protease AprX